MKKSFCVLMLVMFCVAIKSAAAEAGMKVSPSLILALLLRPALENSTLDDILDSQSAVWEYEPGEREAIEKILRSITDVNAPSRDDADIDDAA